MNLFNEFIKIAHTLNKELNITPVLYGSLGLQKETGINFSPQDIDILVPLIYLNEKWSILKKELEQLGYELVDLHEHEFQKNDIKIGVAYMEDLQTFADVDYKHLKKEEVEGVTYKTLTVRDYLKVYIQSILDGY